MKRTIKFNIKSMVRPTGTGTVRLRTTLSNGRTLKSMVKTIRVK